MKRAIKTIGIFLSAILLLASCSSDDDEEVGNIIICKPQPLKLEGTTRVDDVFHEWKLIGYGTIGSWDGILPLESYTIRLRKDGTIIGHTEKNDFSGKFICLPDGSFQIMDYTFIEQQVDSFPHHHVKQVQSFIVDEKSRYLALYYTDKDFFYFTRGLDFPTDFCLNGLNYKVRSGNEVELTLGDERCKGQLEIPSEVSYNGMTYAVTSIGTEAFRFRELEKVIIPEGVTKLDTCAFYLLNNLASVQLPSTLKTIGVSAFQGCKALTEISLPAQLDTIGNAAFMACPIQEIELPSSIKHIGLFAFAAWEDDKDSTAIKQVISHIQTPFEVKDIFARRLFGQPKLIIPKGTKEKYLATKGWDGFKEVCEEQ